MNKNRRQIGYLGPVGTFTEIAVHALFPNEEKASFQSFTTIEKCIEAVQQKEIDFTVVPIENSIGGSVSMTLDWLIHESNVPIQGEVRLPVHHELVANPEQMQADNYEIIYAHPQALKQCSRYLRENYPDVEQRPTNSSAEAAWIVNKNKDKPWLAIANFIAKEIYELSTLKHNIEDNSQNQTRFVLLGYETIPLPEEQEKSTIIVSFPENELMMLRNVLEAIDGCQIKPTKIESAPMKTELGHYVFFIDLDTTGKSKCFKKLCGEIRELGCELRYLGSYPTLQADINY